MPPLLADLDGYGICVSEKRARILAWRSESESESEIEGGDYKSLVFYVSTKRVI